MPRCTVIIPVFNQVALTAKCLGTFLARDACEVVVVDDASTDATAQMLPSLGSRIKVVTHAQNRGFATSCNDGAAAASGDYLVFLNNDTVPGPGWLEALVRYAEAHPEAAVVGAKLLYANNTIQHAGVVICQDGYPRHIYTGFPAEHPAVNKSRPFQIVTAACALVRREAFVAARGFDPAFHNGFEDVDFCLRLGQHGHEIHYCAQSVVHHLESVSPGRFRHDRNNVALYRQRWMGRVRPDDLTYYLEDGLLRLSYEGRYPLHLDVSPLLATVEAGREAESEQLLRERSREVAELLRENSRLRLSLALNAEPQGSQELRYQETRWQIRKVVQQVIPGDATVLVVSKGDGSLLDLGGRRAWHFPQTEKGAYAGHHPASSSEAIAHLKALLARGAEYLVVPAPFAWWLEYYSEFREYLETHGSRLQGHDSVCSIYCLNSKRTELAHAQS